jgi:hypothetical protein
VAMDADGDFVVTWLADLENYGEGIFVRRYTANGEPLGQELLVNANTSDSVAGHTVAMDATGAFVVAWFKNADTGTAPNPDVVARAYSAAGTPLGSEFRVNTYTAEYQWTPAVAMDSDGDVLVVWQSRLQGGSAYDIYAQRYTSTTVAVAPGSGDRLRLAVAPNPLSGAPGRVRYDVQATGPVQVAVYDVLGREVAVLAEGVAAAGLHEAALDTSALAPGVYVLRLTAAGETLTQTVTVTR